MDIGVFVLGMDRSGTSAVTRLINLLGPHTPPDWDVVQPSAKNPTGYWESESLVAFNERLLATIGCHIGCPIPLEPGWEADVRLDSLRARAGDAVREVFPEAPWAWKDPRHCLAFAFWRSVLPIRAVVVLVNRNPLEIAASTLRSRSEMGKIYTLALWERHLRQALGQVEGLPVLVTNYADVLAEPVAWSQSTHAFLLAAGVPVEPPNESVIRGFVDTGLRHSEFGRADVLGDPEVSEAQRALFLALEALEGTHADFSAPVLPTETPTTEALLEERRRAREIRHELTGRLERERQSRWSYRIRRSRLVAPARPAYSAARRLVKAASSWVGGSGSARAEG